jgi:predicted DNA-binding transcriptional regulator
MTSCSDGSKGFPRQTSSEPRRRPASHRRARIIKRSLFPALNSEIPVSQSEVFWYVRDQSSAPTVKEIAEGIRLARTTVQKQVKVLVQVGILQKSGRPATFQIAAHPPQEYLQQLLQLEAIVRDLWRVRV